ncbi:CAP domain-containing protein [Maribacter antarcticus]|uniref:CAP domain-containing protein n=1 Tax=Maribacter antarcticus TaxID=505250 RepID=UPI000686C4B2|nr:CAP domain-containing protein [Maribacter antarcticus]
MESELLKIINNCRVSLNLNALYFMDASYNFDKKHSKHMISQGNKSYDNFANRAEQISMNTGATFVAGNVAKVYDTAVESFEAWLESDGHRPNIEGDYTHSVISVKENEEVDLYFTKQFFKQN